VAIRNRVVAPECGAGNLEICNVELLCHVVPLTRERSRRNNACENAQAAGLSRSAVRPLPYVAGRGQWTELTRTGKSACRCAERAATTAHDTRCTRGRRRSRPERQRAACGHARA